MPVSSRSAIPIPRRKPISSVLRYMPCRFERSLPKLADDAGPILLSAVRTPLISESFFGEGHFPAPTLARYLNEAWLGAGSYGAGKTLLRPHSRPYLGTDSIRTKRSPDGGTTRGSSGPLRGPVTREGKSRHISWLNTVNIRVNT